MILDSKAILIMIVRFTHIFGQMIRSVGREKIKKQLDFVDARS